MVKAKVMGRTMEIPSEVVQFESNRTNAYRSGGFPSYLSVKTFKEVKEGTQVSERIVMERKGVLSWLTGPLMPPISSRSHAANLKELKRILESKVPFERDEEDVYWFCLSTFRGPGKLVESSPSHGRVWRS